MASGLRWRGSHVIVIEITGIEAVIDFDGLQIREARDHGCL
jgi:hypothetical protein